MSNRREARLDLPGEVWKAVPGYDCLYEVSNMGRIWSVPRTVHDVGSGKARRIGGRFKKDNNSSSLKRFQDLGVSLSREGKGISCLVAPLVWEVFVGPVPFGMVVRHLDGDRKNCRLDNLVLRDAERMSLSHRRRHGRR